MWGKSHISARFVGVNYTVIITDDANSDGRVTAADAAKILRFIVRLEQYLVTVG